MVKRFFILVMLILFGLMILPLLTGVPPATGLNPLAAKYVQDGPQELGAANLVTAIVVTYRGLDTLGEVAVLFIATAGVGFLLRRKKEHAESGTKRPASEILRLLITDWVERMHPDLLKKEAGGGFKALEERMEQQTIPTQAVVPVMCWRCHGRIDWRMELGPQGYCPYCGAFIDLRVR